jgi:hypothetical protein
VLFLILSLFIIAASLYLPEHIFIITKRMFYYFSGDEETLNTANKAVGHVFSEAATHLLGNQHGHGGGALAGPGRGVMEA